MTRYLSLVLLLTIQILSLELLFSAAHPNIRELLHGKIRRQSEGMPEVEEYLMENEETVAQINKDAMESKLSTWEEDKLKGAEGDLKQFAWDMEKASEIIEGSEGGIEENEGDTDEVVEEEGKVSMLEALEGGLGEVQEEEEAEEELKETEEIEAGMSEEITEVENEMAEVKDEAEKTGDLEEPGYAPVEEVEEAEDDIEEMFEEMEEEVSGMEDEESADKGTKSEDEENLDSYNDGNQAVSGGGNEKPKAGELSILDCKKEGENCMGIPKCCGDLVCAWAGGLGFKKGQCVDCVGQNGACHRDGQCCSGLQCDKDYPLHVNGICTKARLQGADCFENSQCSGWCERKLFHIWGKCIDWNG